MVICSQINYSIIQIKGTGVA